MLRTDAVIQDFNLISTSERGYESAACSELWMLLRVIGDERPVVDRTPVSGLILAKTALNPVEVIERLRTELNRQPWGFRTLLRVLPTEAVVPTDLKRIAETTQRLASRIKDFESYRITVEKRRTKLRSKEVIDSVASGIKRKVNLNNPNWIILIEIIGRYTGVSVVRPDSLLNVQKEKSKLSLNR